MGPAEVGDAGMNTPAASVQSREGLHMMALWPFASSAIRLSSNIAIR
jgi:hypothetical protein